MLRALIDTNVFLAAVISRFADSSSRQILRALYAREFRLLISEETLRELRWILKLDTIRVRHEWTSADVDEFVDQLRGIGDMIEPHVLTPRSLAHDLTDSKFLDLALAAEADYLVTTDRRHLLRLKKIGRTKIVTPHKFMLALRKSMRAA